MTEEAPSFKIDPHHYRRVTSSSYRDGVTVTTDHGLVKVKDEDETCLHSEEKSQDVEITPEMLSAGFSVFLASGLVDEPVDSDRVVLEEIYRAMYLARRCTSRQGYGSENNRIRSTWPETVSPVENFSVDVKSKTITILVAGMYHFGAEGLKRCEPGDVVPLSHGFTRVG